MGEVAGWRGWGARRAEAVGRTGRLLRWLQAQGIACSIQKHRTRFHVHDLTAALRILRCPPPQTPSSQELKELERERQRQVGPRPAMDWLGFCMDRTGDCSWSLQLPLLLSFARPAYSCLILACNSCEALHPQAACLPVP